MNTFNRSTVRMWWLALFALAAWLPYPPSLEAQDEILFRRTRDPKIIREQIRAALPTLEKGYALLISSMDPDPVATAIGLLHDAYKYLRAAQESSEVLESISKFPDPLVGLRNRQISEIRDHLLVCYSNRTGVAEPGLTRNNCIDGLPPSIRRLRVIVASLPG